VRYLCNYDSIHLHLFLNDSTSKSLLLLQAVCCSDHEHCCPSGTTCDVAAGTCTKNSQQSVSWNKVAVKNVNIVSSNDVVCPGGQAKCPDGSTCCELASGDYGCCPLPKVLHYCVFSIFK